MRNFKKIAAIAATFTLLASTTALAGFSSKTTTVNGTSCYGSLTTDRPASSILSGYGYSSISGTGTAYIELKAYSSGSNVDYQRQGGPNSVSLYRSYSSTQYIDRVDSYHSFSVGGLSGSFTNTAY